MENYKNLIVWIGALVVSLIFNLFLEIEIQIIFFWSHIAIITIIVLIFMAMNAEKFSKGKRLIGVILIFVLFILGTGMYIGIAFLVSMLFECSIYTAYSLVMLGMGVKELATTNNKSPKED